MNLPTDARLSECEEHEAPARPFPIRPETPGSSSRIKVKEEEVVFFVCLFLSMCFRGDSEQDCVRWPSQAGQRKDACKSLALTQSRARAPHREASARNNTKKKKEKKKRTKKLRSQRRAEPRRTRCTATPRCFSFLLVSKHTSATVAKSFFTDV